MSFTLRVRKSLLVIGLAMTCPALLLADSGYVPEGAEYSVSGALPGDQVYPDLALSPSGGWVVWQDNRTDGDGWGVSARRLNANFSGSLSSFRVNEAGVGNQERPRVALLNNGGAAFVWQGGKQGFQRIYARFLSSSNTWNTGDLLVNTFTNNTQVEPAVATLSSGDVVAVWASFNQVSGTSLRDVFAQRLSAAGQKQGGEFRVNQFTTYNQRTPAIAALKDGRFVVVWISEGQRSEEGVDVYARIYSATGVAAGSEFLVNSGTNVCANPSVAPSADGGFAVAWMEKDIVEANNSWDAYARVFTSAGVGGATRRVNTTLYGDQLAPKISAAATGYLVVWTSMGQDGSREGVYGQFLQNDGSPAGGEFRVNTTVVAQQMHPAVGSDGGTQFLVVWTGFTGVANSFDLFGQRYASVSQPLPALDAPFVSVVSSDSLSVTWPALAGFSVARYEVYADGSAGATVSVTNNWWTMTGLAPASTHRFQVAYVLTDGRHSPLSAATTNTTYSALSYGGIPYDWMIANFGNDVFNWPSPTADSDGDGVSNLQEFLAGTDPKSAASVLRQKLQKTAQGLFLSWNTQPGLVYRVQTAVNLGVWSDLGEPRFAAGTTDSLYVGSGGVGYYRIVRLY